MYSDRRELILKYIKESGQASLKELTELCPDVSDMTLRRDLAFLEEKGHIIRTRGGAVAASRAGVNAEDLYSRRAVLHTREKQEIAEKAQALVEPACAMYLDSGSTMLQFIKALPDDNYYIITSDPNIALEAVHKSKTTVTLVGGNLNRNTLSASGVHSMNFVNSVNIDIAFMSASGFNPQTGFTSGAFSECELKSAVMEKARTRVMLMDSSKLEKRMPFTFAHLSDIDVLVSDSKLDSEIRSLAEAENVRVI
ncbi:MAG: DeoR/GlpR transcriptional regulator [Clostridia bacterium]|nr:DeoR/GlpR transcriptional regulator [Clostridia bacterium]